MKPNKRLIHERSHLLLEFPKIGSSGYRAYIPMLENCQVTENQRSNLSQYSLLGRNSNLFSYNGSESRNISVTFKISFLHLLETITKEGLDDKFRQHFTVFYSNKESAKRAFFLNTVTAANFIGTGAGEISANPAIGVPHAKTHREYYQSIAKISTGVPGLFDSLSGDILTFLGSPPESQSERDQYLNKAIDLVIFWINLIRCTTKNHSTNTALGPPIVRLTHGPLYNNIPCVVESYNIRLLDESGFEIQSMLPKQVEIALTMKEVRVGNYRDFEAGKIVDGDNNVGWEAVVETNNMDPYNGSIKL